MLKQFQLLIKLRLTTLVVFSACMSFFIGVEHNGEFIITHFYMLIFGGFLVTASANIFNELIEVESDKKMNRTKIRPLPSGVMKTGQALVLGVLLGIIGTILLLQINIFVGLLSAFCILLYAFVYTPMKKVHPIAVFIGSFPGALPVIIGYFSAFEFPSISLVPIFLFLIQFVWQFPHFWSIAWILDDDYKKAGFRLLPCRSKGKGSALWLVLSCLLLVVAGLLPFMAHIIGVVGAVLLSVSSLVLFYYSIVLYKNLEEKTAKRVMYISFMYLPLALMAFLL